MKARPRIRTDQRLAWLVGLMLLAASAYFYQDPEWNGNSRLDLTRAFVEQGKLSIDAYHEAPGWSTGDKAYVNGHYYSDKAIGASLVAVPLHFLLLQFASAAGVPLSTEAIKHILTTGVMGATFTLAGLSMYFIALKISGSPTRALLPTLGIAFGTMLLPYSAVFYGHVPAAAFLIATFALLHSRTPDREASPAVWFWIGLCVSMAFLSDYTSAPLIVGLFVYALLVLRKLDIRSKVRAAWPAIPGVLLPLGIFFAYNLAIYGRPIAFGYAFEAEERFQEIMGLGLMGMRLPTLGASYHITFDPRFGLFWLSPVLLLAPIGYWIAFTAKKLRTESLVSIYSIVIVFTMNAASFLWYGGSTFGPRLMISALPFFIVPLALLPGMWAWPLGVLGAISTANMLIPLLGQIQYTRLEFRPDRGGFFVAGSPFHGFSLLYDYGTQQVRDLARSGHSPWTLGTALGLPLWLSVVVLTAAESLMAIVFHLTAKFQPPIQEAGGPPRAVNTGQ
ncbi:MAG TPA: hypothetical protein VIU38_10150 [Anaerolineales bacterium]